MRATMRCGLHSYFDINVVLSHTKWILPCCQHCAIASWHTVTTVSTQLLAVALSRRRIDAFHCRRVLGPCRWCVGKYGRALSAVLDSCRNPGLVRKFLGVFRVTAARLKGSVESMRSLQSRCKAANHALGAFSAIVNTNPSEMHSHYVMALCGRPYGRDAWGWPDAARPASDERYRLIAGNPWGCAAFFEMFTRAWCEVFYGWPHGAHCQRDPSCLFGQVCRCWTV